MSLLFVAASSSAQLPVQQQSDAEKRWLKRFSKAYQTGIYTDDIFDDRYFNDYVLKPFQLDEDQAKSFSETKMGKSIIDALVEKKTKVGTVRLLRFRWVEGRRTALFRITNRAGLNYNEYFLKEGADGEVIAWDCEPYIAGERMSVTLRRKWTPIVAGLDPEIKKHMGRRNRLLMENADTHKAMRQAEKKSDHREVIRLYATLPELMKREIDVMGMAVNAYAGLEDWEKHAAVTKAYRSLHKNASNQELITINAYISKKDYEKALELVDALDKRVGGDPHLATYRSTVAYARGDYDKAKRLIDWALRQDPVMPNVYQTAIDMALKEKDWSRVSAMLNGLQGQGWTINNLEEVKGYEGYVQSEEYKLWKRRQSVN